MTQQFRTLDDVIALATFAHRNQNDKAGMPYIEHPLRVMRSVQQQGALPYVQMAAVLHDVTEDTAFTPRMLLDLGVPEAAVQIVMLLDRNLSKAEYDLQVATVTANPNALWWTGSGYVTQDLIPTAEEFYYAAIRKNPGALMDKLADIDDNTQQWRLSYLPQGTQDRLKVKYDKARAQLTTPVARVFDQW